MHVKEDYGYINRASSVGNYIPYCKFDELNSIQYKMRAKESCPARKSYHEYKQQIIMPFKWRKAT